MKRRKGSGKVGPTTTHQYQNGNGQVHEIKVSAKFRPEPDYERLAKALLMFLEEQDKTKSSAPEP